MYLEGNNWIRTMPQKPWYPVKGAKLDCVIQLCGSVHPCKLENNQNKGELKQPSDKKDHPFRWTMING